MGCNGSSLKPSIKFRNNSSTNSSGSPTKTSQAICVVGRCKDPRPPAHVCEEALHILDLKAPLEGFSNGHANDSKNNFGLNILCAEQECMLRFANLESRLGLVIDSEGKEEGEENLNRNDVFSVANHPSQKQFESSKEETEDVLIPGMPNDLAQICLMRVPFVKYDASIRHVSKSWRKMLSSEEFYATRTALKISETFISFVVHGNRVHIFSLKEHSWFCLPPLPFDRNISSPEWNIDPYEWWRIETVAALQGTLFVMGGDQATTYNCIRSTEPANTVHKYDYCTNQWVKVAPMQIPRSNSAAVASKKSILVAGGNEQMDEGASAEVYDPTTNCWSFVSRMHSSMKGCVGVEHRGLIYVKGANLGSGSPIEGELYDPVKDSWIRMNPGLRRGLARGPIASANSQLFVADWKDSLLKMYVIEHDSWEVVAGLPAKISRLVGYRDKLYGLTGKIKVDPYNHHVISDSPDGVWQLDLDKKSGFDKNLLHEYVTRRNCIEVKWSGQDTREVARPELSINSNSLKARIELRISREGINMNSACTMSHNMNREDGNVLEVSGKSSTSNSGLGCNKDYTWKCIWREPKQILKTGSLSWVPSSAHCALLED